MKGREGLAALVAEAKGRGFQSVETLRGYQPLDSWLPYGLVVLPGIDFASWFILGEDIFEGAATSGGLVRGVWGLRR